MSFWLIYGLISDIWIYLCMFVILPSCGEPFFYQKLAANAGTTKCNVWFTTTYGEKSAKIADSARQIQGECTTATPFYYDFFL